MLAATQARKNLFRILERAGTGETIEIGYKGQVFRLAPVQPRISKLANLKRQHILNVDPYSIISTDPNETKEMEAELESDWHDI